MMMRSDRQLQQQRQQIMNASLHQEYLQPPTVNISGKSKNNKKNKSNSTSKKNKNTASGKKRSNHNVPNLKWGDHVDAFCFSSFLKQEMMVDQFRRLMAHCQLPAQQMAGAWNFMTDDTWMVVMESKPKNLKNSNNNMKNNAGNSPSRKPIGGKKNRSKM